MKTIFPRKESNTPEQAPESPMSGNNYILRAKNQTIRADSLNFPISESSTIFLDRRLSPKPRSTGQTTMPRIAVALFFALTIFAPAAPASATTCRSVSPYTSPLSSVTITS